MHVVFLKLWYPTVSYPRLASTSVRSISRASVREMDVVVEQVQGRLFQMKNNSIQEMEAAVEDPSERFYNQNRIAFANGWGVVDANLNKAFPDIKPVTAEEFVDQYWTGVQFSEPA